MRAAAALAALRDRGPLLLVDAAAPFLGPDACHAGDLGWREAARRVCAGELSIAGTPGRGLLAVTEAPLPQALLRVLHGADRRSAAHRALAAALPAASAPWALFEAGRLAWATPGLWRAVGASGGRWAGDLFVHPEAPALAAHLERAVEAEAPPPDLALEAQQDGRAILRPVDLQAALAADRLHRCAERWGLTPAERRELDHLRHGRTSKEAAALEGVSPETNRQRRRQIFAKAGVSTAGALRAAIDGLPHARRRAGRPAGG